MKVLMKLNINLLKFHGNIYKYDGESVVDLKTKKLLIMVLILYYI